MRPLLFFSQVDEIYLNKKLKRNTEENLIQERLKILHILVVMQ